jgi:hypothetical protein
MTVARAVNLVCHLFTHFSPVPAAVRVPVNQM